MSRQQLGSESSEKNLLLRPLPHTNWDSFYDLQIREHYIWFRSEESSLLLHLLDRLVKLTLEQRPVRLQFLRDAQRAILLEGGVSTFV